MNLLIESGILLKPFVRPWTPDGWGRVPPGWTPDRGEWVLARADELQRESPDLPREFALLQAEQDHGEALHAQRKPWPGWVPVDARRDGDISRAYRELFMRMNPDRAPGLPSSGAQWPGDGRYRFVGGRMEMVPGD